MHTWQTFIKNFELSTKKINHINIINTKQFTIKHINTSHVLQLNII